MCGLDRARYHRLSDVAARDATTSASSRVELEFRRRGTVRSDNHINLISYAVCEMFKFAANEGLWNRQAQPPIRDAQVNPLRRPPASFGIDGPSAVGIDCGRGRPSSRCAGGSCQGTHRFVPEQPGRVLACRLATQASAEAKCWASGCQTFIFCQRRQPARLSRRRSSSAR